MIINDPPVVAELEAAVDLYEKALAENDIEQLDAFFWRSEHTLRYGVGENLYGIDAILEFRKARPGGSPPRDVIRRVITTYGQDFATANLEFQRRGGGRVGRQSQTWMRSASGWKVVAAHVSLMADTH
jgi:hypothetical protein